MRDGVICGVPLIIPLKRFKRDTIKLEKVHRVISCIAIRSVKVRYVQTFGDFVSFFHQDGAIYSQNYSANSSKPLQQNIV